MKKKRLIYGVLLMLLCFCTISCTEDELMDEPLTRGSITKASETVFQNQTVSSDRTVTGENVVATNITVTNGALLTLKGSSTVTINYPFTLNAGCELTITH